MKYVITLPDGSNPTAMCNYRGKIYIACDNGKIWQLTQEDEEPLLRAIAVLDSEKLGLL